MVLSALRVHDELVAAGMPEAQVRAVVRVIERQQEDAATKTDLANLETRLFERLEHVNVVDRRDGVRDRGHGDGHHHRRDRGVGLRRT